MTKVVSLLIKTKDVSNKKQSINITYVNPSAENDKLREFAENLVALTTESYQGVTKITKESVI